MSEIRYQTVHGLSQVLNMDRAAVAKHISHAGIKPHSKTPDGRYDRYDAQEVLQYIFDERGKRNAKLAEKLRYATARREKIDLELDKLKSELVPISEVAEVVQREYALVRARFGCIPSEVAPLIARANTPEECFEILERAVDSALTDLTKE